MNDSDAKVLHGDGVIPYQGIKLLNNGGSIKRRDKRAINFSNISSASLDLTCSNEINEISSSFLPSSNISEIEELIKKFKCGEDVKTTDEGVLLKKDHTYIIKLNERLELPPNLRAKANPKSSTGRLDILVRLLTEGYPRYDDVSYGYRGDLYLEVTPLSFPIFVKEDYSLNQIRFMSINPKTLNDNELSIGHFKHRFVFLEDEPITPNIHENGILIGVGLKEFKKNYSLISYKAKEGIDKPIDLRKEDEYHITDYWEIKHVSDLIDGERLKLEKGGFYLLCTKQRIAVPTTFAAEMLPYDVGNGEFRIHYAGFFDSGFGYNHENIAEGGQAILEIRVRDIPIIIKDGQPLCKFIFSPLTEETEMPYATKGQYSSQLGPTLPKCFKKEKTTLPT